MDAAPAGAGTLAEARGLAVLQDEVARPEDGPAALLVARIDPARMRAHVVEETAEEEDRPVEDGVWSVSVNASYFDAAGRPVYLLRDGPREFAPFRRGGNAVFWCARARCAIQHSSDFDPRGTYDIAVQSSPRLMAGGRPTTGVRGADMVDGRAGLAITTGGHVLVFATAPQRWSGLSFDRIRDHLAKTHGARDILMLDGGDSAQLAIRIGDRTLRSGLLPRSVPHRLVFAPR